MLINREKETILCTEAGREVDIEMKEEKKIEFTQKWIGDAVKKLLQKEDIYKSDMERIKYMRIGDCDFGGEYTIEMSTATPPEPFCTTDGGDEWAMGGGANVTGRFIQLYIDYVKEEPFDYIDSDTGERFFQLPPYMIYGKNLKRNMKKRKRKKMMKMKKQRIGKVLRRNGNLSRKPSCARHIERNLATTMLTRNGSGGQIGAFSRISACLPGWRCCGFLAQNIRI